MRTHVSNPHAVHLRRPAPLATPVVAILLALACGPGSAFGGELLENGNFQAASILGSGQTEVAPRTSKLIETNSQSGSYVDAISGIPGWSYGLYLTGTLSDHGISRMNTEFGRPAANRMAFINNWERMMSQTVTRAWRAGDVVTARIEFGTLGSPDDGGRAGTFYLVAGEADPSNLDHFSSRSRLLAAVAIGNPDWSRTAIDSRVANQVMQPLELTYRFSDFDPALDLPLTIAFRTEAGSVGPTFWDNASLAVGNDTAPVITQQPIANRVPPGSRVALRVQAVGQEPLTYQWRRNGQDIAQATLATLELPAIRPDQAGVYTVVVSNPYGTVESDPALLSLDLPALGLMDAFAERRLFTEPSAVGITDNTGATREPGEPRHANKSGGSSLWMAWRPAFSGRATFRTTGSGFDTVLAVYQGGDVSGLTTVAADDDSGGFQTSRVQFNAVAGQEYAVAIDGFDGASGTVVLDWNLEPGAPAVPEIERQPVSALVVEGELAQFYVVTPTPNVNFQWFRNGKPVAGAQGPVLVYPNATPDLTGDCFVRLTTPEGGQRDSEPASLEIVSRPQATLALSTDKLADLFPETTAAGPALQRRTPATALPPSVGLPGSQWTDNTSSTRSLDDPATCQATTSASRWFRLRFNVPGTVTTPVKITSSGSEIATLVAVFTNRFLPTLLACDVAVPTNHPFAEVQIQARRNVDYLVLVDGLHGARGRIQLNWEGEELPGPTFGVDNGHFATEIRVVPGVYDWEQTLTVGGWQGLFRTNVESGIFRFADPNPATGTAAFYRLNPVR